MTSEPKLFHFGTKAVDEAKIELCTSITCDKGKTLKEGTCEVVDCTVCNGWGWVVR